MNDIHPEILIVDDVPNAAEDFGALISAKYNFECISTDRPEKALDIVKKYAIKVAVLDQKMPLMSGIELFKKLKEINPLLKAIMLSGEAGNREVGEAYDRGYESFLDKSSIGQLPDKVFELYTKFEVEFARKFNLVNFPVILSDGFTIFGYHLWPKHVIHFHLLNIEIINDGFVFGDRWSTIAEIHAGQSLEMEETYRLEETITVNKDFEQKLKSEFNLSDKKLDLLRINISREVNSKWSTSVMSKKSSEKKSRVTYSLPPQPLDLASNYVVKRIFEYNPIFTEFRGIICKHCKYCGKYQPMTVVFYKQSKKILSRQIDIMKNSELEIIETGTTQYF